MLTRANSTGGTQVARLADADVVDDVGGRHFLDFGVVPVAGGDEIEAADALGAPARIARRRSMPSVLVSTPLMKKRATVAPNGAISAATCGVLRFSESTMRSSDVDAVGIDGGLEAAEAEHRAERVVARLLGIERLRAERDRDVRRGRERADFERHAVDEVGGRGGEEFLLQSRGAESRRDTAPRSANESVKSKRAAILPVTAEPKSE